MQNHLVRKKDGGYALNFACFTRKQFDEFCALYKAEDGKLDDMLCDWILSVRKSFEGFVPARLHGQINQWISVYCGELAGYVTEELIRRGRLEKPGSLEEPEAQPFVDGVFYVEGDFMLI